MTASVAGLSRAVGRALTSSRVHKGTARLDVDRVEVERGDTIDFVVDIYKILDSDQYLWVPEIREISAGPGLTWDAARDFDGPLAPRLTPTEQLAQVLLMANELMFVD